MEKIKNEEKNNIEKKSGEIRIGRQYPYDNYTSKRPIYDNFTSIVIVTKSSNYGSLSSCELKDENGRILENIWQFSKLYSDVPQINLPYSKYTPNHIVWKWAKEKHAKKIYSDSSQKKDDNLEEIKNIESIVEPSRMDNCFLNNFFDKNAEFAEQILPIEDGQKPSFLAEFDGTYEITNKYWVWRAMGMSNRFPIRFPFGNKEQQQTKRENEDSYKELSCNDRTKSDQSQNLNDSDATNSCFLKEIEDDYEKLNYLCFLKEIENGYEQLNYVSARKMIYLENYSKYVKNAPQYKILKEKLERGENLLIIDIDGPHMESLDYYVNKYNVEKNFIDNHTMLATLTNLEIMLKDTLHCFGHGYCLAATLLGFDQILTLDTDLPKIIPKSKTMIISIPKITRKLNLVPSVVKSNLYSNSIDSQIHLLVNILNKEKNHFEMNNNINKLSMIDIYKIIKQISDNKEIPFQYCLDVLNNYNY